MKKTETTKLQRAPRDEARCWRTLLNMAVHLTEGRGDAQSRSVRSTAKRFLDAGSEEDFVTQLSIHPEWRQKLEHMLAALASVNQEVHDEDFERVEAAKARAREALGILHARTGVGAFLDLHTAGDLLVSFARAFGAEALLTEGVGHTQLSERQLTLVKDTVELLRRLTAQEPSANHVEQVMPFELKLAGSTKLWHKQGEKES